MATSEPRTNAASKRRKRPDKAPRRDRDDWLEAARSVLISSGVDRVKVEPLAQTLGVTTGSFYHHFKNRQELLDALLRSWELTNSLSLFRAVESAGDDANAQFDALLNVWVSESDYSPIYDSAVRAWAHASKTVEATVRRVDDRRIELLAGIFRSFGYDAERAFIRARITYFHQVGYQAMDIEETVGRRRELLGLYREALLGSPPKPTPTRKSK
jgi:AcrR family transcriptional regulator